MMSSNEKPDQHVALPELSDEAGTWLGFRAGSVNSGRSIGGVSA
jgi:hypothetical protein